MISPTPWSRAALGATALIGISVWAQLCVPTLLEPALPWVKLLSVLPVIVLVAGVVARSPVALLLLVPVSMLPGLAAMPLDARVALSSVWGAGRVVVSVGLYLAVAGVWLAGTQPASAHDEKLDQAPENPYRWILYSRAAVLFALLVVPTYAVFFDAPIVSTIASNHLGGERIAQTFIALCAFFVWTVVAYTQFLVPMLNMEYDRRKLQRRALESVRQTTLARSARRVGIEAGGVVLFIVLLLAV